MPLETAAAQGAPTRSAISSSKRLDVGPSESRPPERSTVEDGLLVALAEVRARESGTARVFVSTPPRVAF